MIIPLEKVIIDDRARDGTWCRIPYRSNSKGCPNFPKCIEARPHFNTYDETLHWYAVVLRFDLKAHAEEMKKKPRKNGKAWTEAQARCVLYWQEHKVRKPLRAMAMKICVPLMGDVLLDIPEANGVQVFETMEKHGLVLDRRNPDIIHKIMFVGRRTSLLTENQRALRSEDR